MGRKPKIKRDKETLELEPPWSGIRRQWEGKDPEAERRAQQFVEGGMDAVEW